MNVNNYPRILIFGQPFNHYSGGGITLTNLFKGWPQNKIAVTATGHVLQKTTTDICRTYYQLGKDEQRWVFPLNLIQRSFPSGLISFDIRDSVSMAASKSYPRQIIVDKLFFPFMHWIGLFHCLSKTSLSPKFKDWLSEYHPEVLYIQVSTREEILFSIQLHDYLKLPTIIHMMDDWPSTISKKSLLRNYWSKKIDGEFRKLLERVDQYLSISNAMSSEYRRRYSKSFEAFHNPIDISKYNHTLITRTNQHETFRVLYIGRIGLANKNSISLFSRAISSYSFDNLNVTLDIFTNNHESRESKKIAGLNNITIRPPVKHEEIPTLLKQYDLLLLPLDFTETGLKFARYSIPTKASEYMISGTPILVFAPEETAISKFCAENNCAYCLTNQSDEDIIKAVKYIVGNNSYRNKISNNAKRIAQKLFDEDNVRKKFQHLIITSIKTENHVYK